MYNHKLIPPDKRFNLYNSPMFKQFIYNRVLVELASFIELKQVYLEPYFNLYGISYKEVIKELPRFIQISAINDKLFIGFTDRVILNKTNLRNVINSIDYGSNLTGYPKRIFCNYFKQLTQHINKYYLMFWGLIK